MTTFMKAKGRAVATASLSLLSRTLRSVRRRGKTMSSGVFHVVLLAGLLIVCSGYFRPAVIDQKIGAAIQFVQTHLHHALANGWLDPRIANVVVGVGSYAAFAGLLLFAASLVRRIPAFTGFLILSEMNRRQGRNVSTLELLLGLSMPIAVAFAMASISVLSLYACIHFVLCYAYIRLSNNSSRVDNILNWYVKVRTPMDSGSEPDDDGDMDE